MQNDLDRQSSGPAGFGVIAERFRRAGQPERAAALCREGLEKFPDHLSARVTLGWSLLDMGEHREAFDQLKSVLKRAPDNLAAIRGLAELHERGIGFELESAAELDSFENEEHHVAPVEEIPEVEELDPVVEPARFEIEDVIDAFGEIDEIDEIEEAADADDIAAVEIERTPVSLFERAPLALRDEADADRVGELKAWLSRVRARRSTAMTEYMAS